MLGPSVSFLSTVKTSLFGCQIVDYRIKSQQLPSTKGMGVRRGLSGFLCGVQISAGVETACSAVL